MAFYRTEYDYRREIIKRNIRKDIKEHLISHIYILAGLFFLLGSLKMCNQILTNRYYLGGLTLIIAGFFSRWMDYQKNLTDHIRKVLKEVKK